MQKTDGTFRIIAGLVFLVANLFLSQAVIALPALPAGPLPDALPSSVLPERAASNFSTQPSSGTSTLPPGAMPAQKKEEGSLGPAAAKIQFKLEKVILRGNHVYSDEQLSALYKNKLHKQISVAALQDIVQDITNYYRNNGYILSRAVLPPQHVNGGIVVIQVIEGYIGHVNVIGDPKGAKPLVEAYGRHISASRPLRVNVMEYYLLLANEIPGVQVKAVLEPSKTLTGASDLNLVTQTKTFSGYVSYDNYGTLYLGPLQDSAGGELDSIFLPGDTSQLSVVETTRPQQMKFMQLTYGMPFFYNGSRFSVSGNQALTRPGLNLANRALLIDGVADTFTGMIQYPIWRTRSKSLTLDTGFNYIDSRVVATTASLPLYTDHLRYGRIGGALNISDSWNGANSFALHMDHGFLIWGATPTSKADTGTTSRFGADGYYTKYDSQLSRLQQFGQSRYSAFINIAAQYSAVPLLASEQFSYGGVSQGLGRGYDPSEIIGDRGLAGSLELRANYVPDLTFLNTMQAYVFYDEGAIWNKKPVPDQKSKQSAASIGMGSRFFFTRSVSGNLLIAQPLTRIVDALQAANQNDRRPRIFFSITATA
jgi:hemolysin activation/secretion protein